MAVGRPSGRRWTWGDADGVPTSTTVVNHANATNWAIGALGLEETDITDLVSPPSGPAHLLSTMGDLGGFTHTTLDHSPPSQQLTPQFTSGYSIDFAQANPLIVVRDGSPAYAQTQAGAYSSDGGVTWSAFATQPAGLGYRVRHDCSLGRWRDDRLAAG